MCDEARGRRGGRREGVSNGENGRARVKKGHSKRQPLEEGGRWWTLVDVGGMEVRAGTVIHVAHDGLWLDGFVSG